MAALHEEGFPEDALECANCGTTQNLLKCSKCHTAWFCGVKCQKAYWPFHKSQCKRNEFADAVEEREPKFAAWMRRHGKLAVLKDDEVDRLERASAATSGNYTRQEVMESMYGRAEPKPAEPSYTAEERAAMRRAAEAEKAAARLTLQQGQQYAAIDVPLELGLDCQRYKWRQNQSHVEVFVPLPPGVSAAKVQVALGPSTLSVEVDEAPVLRGALWAEIKAEESTWYVQDGVLELLLLKRCRRGHYEAGKNNADTFWRSVLRGAAPHEVLPLEHPPLHYYSAPREDGEKERPAQRLRQRAGAVAESQQPAITAA